MVLGEDMDERKKTSLNHLTSTAKTTGSTIKSATGKPYITWTLITVLYFILEQIVYH